MKTSFIILILSVLPFEIMAQGNNQLSSEMAAFKEYCIRVANAAATCNTDELSACIENWEPGEYDSDGYEINPEILTYNDVEITYSHFSDLETKDAASEVIQGIHFGFTPKAVDKWITNHCEVMEVADANQLRGDAVQLEYTVRTLPAHTRATYITQGGDDVEMFVVAEKDGKIRFSIHAVEQGGDNKVTDLADNSGAQSAQLAWSMYYNGSIEFTVENVGNKEVSFIVAKKM